MATGAKVFINDHGTVQCDKKVLEAKAGRVRGYDGVERLHVSERIGTPGGRVLTAVPVHHGTGDGRVQFCASLGVSFLVEGGQADLSAGAATAWRFCWLRRCLWSCTWATRSVAEMYFTPHSTRPMAMFGYGTCGPDGRARGWKSGWTTGGRSCCCRNQSKGLLRLVYG